MKDDPVVGFCAVFFDSASWSGLLLLHQKNQGVASRQREEQEIGFCMEDPWRERPKGVFDC